MTKLNVYIATIFPEVFPGICNISLLKKAIIKNIWSYNIINIKDFAINKRIDDKIYGGMPGMLIKAEVIEKIINHYNNQNIFFNKILYTNPQGTILNQKYLENFKNHILDFYNKDTKDFNLLIISGRYEGIDPRVIDYYNIEEFSLGEFVLCGGEIPTMALIEGLIRLLPGVLGNHQSLLEESFTNERTLQYKKYTRPREWKNMLVPEVLFNGNHKEINKWKYKK